ncbi:MAG TPA: hypothetical protein VHD32_07545 [Candidatus Didemnitutus sp.]|nr:hypothetical protein [Candidatus Didemnitutus sp.]
MKRVLVIPTLGESAWLAEAVASASALGRDVRVVLVAPPDRVAGLLMRFSGVEVFAEKGRGLYRALNEALESAGEWDYGSYLNDDDLLFPGAVKMPPAGADIFYGRVDYVDGSGRRLGSFPIETSPERISAVFSAGIPGLTPQGTWISRRAYEQLGGFDAGLKYCGDFDFWRRAAERGCRFAFNTALVGAFRLRPGQLSREREAAAAERARVDARTASRPGSLTRALIRFRFRLRHLPLIWERRRLTGHWRSADLFSDEGK